MILGALSARALCSLTSSRTTPSAITRAATAPGRAGGLKEEDDREAAHLWRQEKAFIWMKS
jgi:hypothetical protein